MLRSRENKLLAMKYVASGDDDKDRTQRSGKGVGESRKLQLTAIVVKEEAKAEVETKTAKETSKIKDSPSSMTIWLQFKDMVLKENDKPTIESGECLMDQHMNFTQRLLKHQYPKMNGLRPTLLQGQAHSQGTLHALQVLHILTNHWIVANTKEKGHVYNSVYSSVNQAAAQLI